MSTIEKRGKRWRARIREGGVTESKTFETKAHAMQWALDRERQVKAGIRPDHTLHRMLEKYAEEVSPGKRGGHWELLRIGAMKRLLPDHHLSKITATDLAKWRDKRLKTVSGESFIRDLTLLSSAWEMARREWKWTDENPCRELKRPARSLGRDRLISDAERDEMLAALGWSGRVWRLKDQVSVAFLLALETGMRAGEICSLTPDKIKKDYALLPMTKNGKPRAVPLSPKARKILKYVPEGFTITSRQLDANFRRHRPKDADYVFHDTRHTAITRLARVLPIMDLARMMGHSDTRTLMRYYNATASDIATLLAAHEKTLSPHHETSGGSVASRAAGRGSRAL